MYTTRTKPWVRAPPHRELKIAAPVQLCLSICLLLSTVIEAAPSKKQVQSQDDWQSSLLLL